MTSAGEPPHFKCTLCIYMPGFPKEDSCGPGFVFSGSGWSKKDAQRQAFDQALGNEEFMQMQNLDVIL
jgi:hypothetical protein